MRRINKFLFLLLMMAASVFTAPAEASCIYNKTGGNIDIGFENERNKYTLNNNGRKCFQNKGGQYDAKVGSRECFIRDVGAHDWVKVYASNNTLRCTFKDTGMTADELKAERDREKNNRWVQVPGAAIDVGIGMDGSVFVVGISENPLFRFNYDRMNWDKIEAAGTGLSRVDVDKEGNPWWVTQDHKIFTLNMKTGVKTQLPGEARDIGVGGVKSETGTYYKEVYIVSNQAAPGGFVIMRLNANRNGWVPMAGNGTHIDVDQARQGLPVISNDNNDIFYSKVSHDDSSWRPTDSRRIEFWFIGRKGRDVGVGRRRGQVAYVGLNGSPMIGKVSDINNIASDSQWERRAGRPLSLSISLPATGVPGLWMTDINNNIFYWHDYY